MLHGARGAAVLLQPLAQAVSPGHRIHLLNLAGHGGRPLPERYSLALLGADVLAQMDAFGLHRVRLFGYSLGGTLALWLACHHPDRIEGWCVLAPKLRFDARTVAHFTHLASLDRIERPGSPQPALLERLHRGQDWRAQATRLADMYRRFGERAELEESALRALRTPGWLISASEDPLLPWPEFLELHRLLPGSHAFSFSGSAHPLEALPLPRLAGVIRGWLAGAPTPS